MTTPKVAYAPVARFVQGQLEAPGVLQQRGIIVLITTLLSLRDVPDSPGHFDMPPMVVNMGVPNLLSSVTCTAKKSPETNK